MNFHPAITLYGTSLEYLEQEATEAAEALRGAVSALGRACPVSRDYSVTAYTSARNEHGALVAQVQAALAAMEDRLEYLAKARDEITANKVAR
jgi:hypothetical protein